MLIGCFFFSVLNSLMLSVFFLSMLGSLMVIVFFSQRVEGSTVGRNRYQTLAAYHTGVVLRYAHGGPAFLPWHRIYLLL